MWASAVIKDHLIKGYTTYEKRLRERGVKELQYTIELLQKTLKQNDLVTDIGNETIGLIISYTKTWQLLLAYDEETLILPDKGKQVSIPLTYESAIYAIEKLKCDLAVRGEATDLFGN